MLLEERPTNDFFPLLNACLNGTSALLLFLGYIWIKKKKREAHKRTMWAAFGTSSLFLISYIYYHLHYASQKFHGPGWLRPFYFGMLFSHVLLATLNLPFILRTLYLAQKKDFLRHRALARWVWPIWIYVSVTGVLIYCMLYF